ncbi:MAG: hypothetical protein K0Q83_4044 [Deltaproteobacteria bacterium]|nr:hypothetical protein [Deltaproteobacteria bacterium]
MSSNLPSFGFALTVILINSISLRLGPFIAPQIFMLRNPYGEGPGREVRRLGDIEKRESFN